MPFDRTFHPDEANQAFTTGRLLETGLYRYDPQDHHGPTLYYAAAALQKASGHTSTATLDATLLRCTPLLFAALALVFGFLAVRKATRSTWAGLAFIALLGTAPAFVFFATDFIQEMLLVCFTMAMLWAGVGYLNPKGRIKPGTWALVFGIFAGLAFATKETAVLTFAAAGIAGLPFLLSKRRIATAAWAGRQEDETGRQSTGTHVALAAMGFALTTALLYSSFCSNWEGVYGAFVSAPLSYLHRAAGDAVSQGAAAHVHPWWQHLKWTFFAGSFVKDGTMHWRTSFSELTLLTNLLLLIVPVYICAMVKNLANASPARNAFAFAALYTSILLAFYSAIPYKTPWCALQPLVGFMLAIASGLALCRDVCLEPRNRGRGGISPLPKIALSLVCFAVIPIPAIICDHIPGLRMIASDPDSKAIPYNYAAASPQVKDLAAAVADVASKCRSEEHRKAFIAVALPPEDTWPLPFYLRSVKAGIGYWTQFGELEALAGLGRKPDAVIVPAEEGHLVQPLFPHLKNTQRFEMRPRVRVRIFW